MPATCKRQLTSLEDVSASTAACAILEMVLTLHGAKSLAEIVEGLRRSPAPPAPAEAANHAATTRLRDDPRGIAHSQNVQRLPVTGPLKARRATAYAAAKHALQTTRQGSALSRKEHDR
jgi:hypothetical protein